MEEWKEYKLEEIGTIVGGATPSTKEPHNYDGNISWITPKDLSNNSGRYISRGERMITSEGYNSCSCKMLPKGSVLFSSRAPIGYVAIASNELCTNQGFKSIIPDEQFVNSTFLYYLLVYNKAFIEGLGSGTTFKEVSGNVMKNVVVKIPCLEIQRQIANVLSSLDDKIEVNRRINDNLEQQAQALFKSWFVDFEPFRDQPFVESELGMIPEGWSATVLEELCSFISRGLTPKYDDSSDELILGQTCVRNNIVTLDNARKHKPKQKTEKWVQLWDTLINSTGVGSLGRVGIVYFDMNNVAIDSHITVARAKSALLRHYVGRNLLGRQFEIENMAVGSTGQTELPKDRVKSLPIVLPDDNALTRFNAIIEPIAYQLYRNIEESRRLAELRDTLLPRLMSGELSVDGLKGQFAVSPGRCPGSNEHVSNKTAL